MQIIVDGIITQALIGCYNYERHATQEVVVDLHAKLYPFNWMIKDALETTVNYDELVDYVKECINNTHYHLLESLIEDVSAKVMANFKLIQQLSLKMTKTALCGIKANKITVKHEEERKFCVALALGSNLGNAPKQQLVTAIEILGKYISDVQIGGCYETKPFGFIEQNNFYNTAITGYTTLKPEVLFGKIKAIEKLMGKEELIKNGPRIIDIDIIFIDELVYTHNFLNIPHIAMHQRDFVLAPLADVAANWRHPQLQQTVAELYANLDANERFILRKVEYAK